jgi:hypothetical protein
MLAYLKKNMRNTPLIFNDGMGRRRKRQMSVLDTVWLEVGNNGETNTLMQAMWGCA